MTINWTGTCVSGSGYTTVSDGGIAYDYEVNGYVDLPADPIDGLVVKTLTETITPGYLRWSDLGATWYLMQGSISNPAQLPVESINVSPPVACGSGAVIVSGGTVSYSWNGASWDELNPAPVGFVSESVYASVTSLETAFPAASNSGSLGLATRSTESVLYKSDGVDWLIQPYMNSVATFSLLPLDLADGTRYKVTGEAGLTDCIVVWNRSDGWWDLEQVTASYNTYSAVEWGASPGRWYSSGGLEVYTLIGARLSDSTYKVAFYWNGDAFVPYNVYMGNPGGVKSIKGDSTVAPTGWTFPGNPSTGIATIATDLEYITLTTSTSAASGNTYYGFVGASDASLISSANFYFRGIVQITTLSGNTASLRVTISDGTYAYDVGSVRYSGAQNATGQIYNAATSVAYTASSGQTADLTTAPTMLEIMKLGTKFMYRFGGGDGIWSDAKGSNMRSGVGSTRLEIYVVCNPPSAVASACTAKFKHIRGMRF